MSKYHYSSIMINRLKIHHNLSLANFTTWRIGGHAEWFAEPTNIEEIEFLISWSLEKKIPCRVIGAGSNLLINDTELQGLTICLRKLNGYEIDKNDGVIEALGGENIPSLARRAAKSGLHGLEWAVGIPGTVGGAAVMNAGAQGSSTSDWIQSVKVISLEGKEPFDLNKKELSYSYRYSRLQNEKLIVLNARFQLKPGHDIGKLLKATNQNLNKRTASQPYHLPSCGSVFRNPEPYKAGELIENLGLKGFSIGGAEVSKMHANFIVNKGNASAQDINRLIKHIQDKVKESYGIKLQTEVKKLGFDQRI